MANRSHSTRRGHGAGSLFQRTPSGPWIARFTDGRGVRVQRSTGTRSRADAEQMLRAWVVKAGQQRGGLIAPDDAPTFARHGKAAIADHLAAFELDRRAAGRTDRYVVETTAMVTVTAEACGWRALSDIDADSLRQFIAGQTSTEPGAGWTSRTAAKCITVCRTFTRWCVREGRLVADPLAQVQAPRVRRKRERRVLLPAEWYRLQDATETGPTRHGMPGPVRRLLYALALETGLRSSELRALRRSNLILGESPPHVLLGGQFTKNRAPARQFIRPELASELRSHASMLAPAAPVFTMPRRENISRMLRADLAAARARWIAEAAGDLEATAKREQGDFLCDVDHEGRIVDFHALRHSCGGWAAMGGASPKALQTLMRHSSIKLTLDTYGHLLPDEAAATVTRMPPLRPRAEITEHAAGGAS